MPPQGFTLSYSQVKQFDFEWTAALGAEYYQFLERESSEPDYVQVSPDTSLTAVSLTVPLHRRLEASYVVRACNDFGCMDSAPVDVVGPLAEAVGYFKASNTDADDRFGYSVALNLARRRW